MGEVVVLLFTFYLIVNCSTFRTISRGIDYKYSCIP